MQEVLCQKLKLTNNLNNAMVGIVVMVGVCAVRQKLVVQLTIGQKTVRLFSYSLGIVIPSGILNWDLGLAIYHLLNIAQRLRPLDHQGGCVFL